MKNFILLFALILSSTVFGVRDIVTHKLLDGVGVTTDGDAVEFYQDKKVFQAYGTTSTGAGTAVIDVEASTNGTYYNTIDTLSLTLSTTATTDHYVMDAPWKYVRGILKTLTGSTPSITLEANELNRFY